MGGARKPKACSKIWAWSTSYTDVDLLQGKERDEVMDEIRKHNPKTTLPTLVINNEDCMVGYDEEKIRNKLEVDGTK